jgi:hypothetical protein
MQIKHKAPQDYNDYKIVVLFPNSRSKISQRLPIYIIHD